MSEDRTVWSHIHEALRSYFVRGVDAIEVEIVDYKATAAGSGTIDLRGLRLIEHGFVGSIHRAVRDFRMTAANDSR